LSSAAAVVVSVSMNKLSKPASNCRTAKSGTTHVNAAQATSVNIVSLAAWLFCSYTNDVARMAESCQACLEAKKAAAE
jgi:hypothetical protein